jgi:hypothetical protein
MPFPSPQPPDRPLFKVRWKLFLSKEDGASSAVFKSAWSCASTSPYFFITSFVIKRRTERSAIAATFCHRISVRTSAILVLFVSQTNYHIVSPWSHNCFLPDPIQLVSHLPFRHNTLHRLQAGSFAEQPGLGYWKEERKKERSKEKKEESKEERKKKETRTKEGERERKRNK